MFCYRDMTFCPYWRGCQDNDKCGRAYTPEVKAAARKWWNTFDISEQKHPPVCFYAAIPKCYKPIEKCTCGKCEEGLSC